MQLRHGEVIIHSLRRHRTPYVLKLLNVAIVSLPIFAGLIYVSDKIGIGLFFYLLAVLSFFVGIIVGIISMDFLLDKLVITNKRVVWVNWKSLFKREEHEAEHIDIQDIETLEKGILSSFKIFDYGVLTIETAASKTCIVFKDCPDPEHAKNLIEAQVQKDKTTVIDKKDPPASSEDWSVN